MRLLVDLALEDTRSAMEGIRRPAPARERATRDAGFGNGIFSADRHSVMLFPPSPHRREEGAQTWLCKSKGLVEAG